MKVPHYVYLALALVSLVIGQILGWQQSGSISAAGWVISVLSIVKAVIAMFSDSVPTEIAKAKLAAARFATVLLVLGCGLAGARSLTACALFAKVAPSGAALLVCIVDDASKGDSIAQIAEDCSTDVPAVIGALVSAEAPVGIKATPAYGEAQRALAVPVSR